MSKRDKRRQHTRAARWMGWWGMCAVLWAAALPNVGCEPESGFSTLQVAAELSTAEVVFDPAFVGRAASSTLTVHNRGETPLHLALAAATQGPFTVSLERDVVQVGARADVTVTVEPAAVGTTSATFSLGVKDHAPLVFAARAVVLERPDCASENPCVHAYFDEDTGTCLTETLPDGVACDDGDACTVQTRCAQGTCLGVPRDCDDGVACTVDTCDSQAGCVAAPVADRCDDGNPCSEDTCDPQSGCQHQDAPLNTVCAYEGCASIGFCVLGACQVTTHTDGLPCEDGNLCTTNDRCQAGECVPGPGESGGPGLSEAFVVPTGVLLASDGEYLLGAAGAHGVDEVLAVERAGSDVRILWRSPMWRANTGEPCLRHEQLAGGCQAALYYTALFAETIAVDPDPTNPVVTGIHFRAQTTALQRVASPVAATFREGSAWIVHAGSAISTLPFQPEIELLRVALDTLESESRYLTLPVSEPAAVTLMRTPAGVAIAAVAQGLPNFLPGDGGTEGPRPMAREGEEEPTPDEEPRRIGVMVGFWHVDDANVLVDAPTASSAIGMPFDEQPWDNCGLLDVLDVQLAPDPQVSQLSSVLLGARLGSGCVGDVTQPALWSGARIRYATGDGTVERAEIWNAPMAARLRGGAGAPGFVAVETPEVAEECDCPDCVCPDDDPACMCAPCDCDHTLASWHHAGTDGPRHLTVWPSAQAVPVRVGDRVGMWSWGSAEGPQNMSAELALAPAVGVVPDVRSVRPLVPGWRADLPVVASAGPVAVMAGTANRGVLLQFAGCGLTDVALSAQCMSDADCPGAHTCTADANCIDGPACPRACQPPALSAGALCGHDGHCAPGFACAMTACPDGEVCDTTFRCLAAHAQSCDDPVPCPDGWQCGGEGTPCTPPGGCWTDAPACGPNAVCVGAADGEQGEACTNTHGCAGYCVSAP